MESIDSIKLRAKDDGKFFYLLVGGYTAENSRGIRVYKFDSKSGAMSYHSQSTPVENPSYLCIDSTGKFVYAVSEQEQGGAAYAYSFDRQTGQPAFINKQPIQGSASCYIAVDKGKKHVFVANYQSGSLSVLPLHEDGSLLPLNQQIQQQGNSINKERQEGPHVHTAFLSPDEQYLLYTDLGTDHIYCCRYQSWQQQPLSAVSVTSVKPGSGPRHLAFSKDGRYLYVVTELSGDVIVYAYDNGGLQSIQTLTMLTENFKGEAGGGDIQISPNGLFLYASNRGDANEIIVFSIDQDTGKLTFTQRCSCMGRSPRNIAIDPTGAYLLVANQQSSSISVFKLDNIRGMIGEVVFTIATDQPSCLKFIA